MLACYWLGSPRAEVGAPPYSVSGAGRPSTLDLCGLCSVGGVHGFPFPGTLGSSGGAAPSHSAVAVSARQPWGTSRTGVSAGWVSGQARTCGRLSASVPWRLPMEFLIGHTWDGHPVTHKPVLVRLSPDNDGNGDGDADRGLVLEVSAPFFNDPPAPPGEPSKPFSRLWDFEVVEAFFLNDVTERYLEVELCPHGQHLVLLLSGRRNVWKQELALSFHVSRGETKWEGRAHLPWSYFPPNVTKFNAYAIHGSAGQRCYEALYPVPQEELRPGQSPDFHRLDYFRPLSLNRLFGQEWKQPESSLWSAGTAAM